MKFIFTFTFKTDVASRDQAISRFLGNGGMPPAGVQLLGRWTRSDFASGFILLETDDAQALCRYSLEWSDLLDLALHPVVEDPQLVEVLQGHGK